MKSTATSKAHWLDQPYLNFLNRRFNDTFIQDLIITLVAGEIKQLFLYFRLEYSMLKEIRLIFITISRH